MSVRTPIAPHLAALALLAGALPAQAGLVDVFWGPAWLEADARSEYIYTGTGLNVVDQESAPVRYLSPSVFPGFPAGGVFETAAASSVQTRSLPDGTSGPKDTADGRVAVQYTVGTGGAADSFSFDFSGIVSNEDSWLSPGKPADFASVQLRGVVVIEISQNSGDRTGFWFGDRVGSITLQPLRAAAAYESFSLQVSAFYEPGRPVLLTQAAGGPGATLDLYFGERYIVQLDYLMQVPFGIDPPISLQLGGSVSAVPEPAPAALLAAGLLALARQPAPAARRLTGRGPTRHLQLLADPACPCWAGRRARAHPLKDGNAPL